MKRIAFDIETNGLIPTLTRIHHLVLKDLDTREVVSCTDDPHPVAQERRASGRYRPLAYGLRLLAEAELLVGHNVIRFDVPAIRKLYPKWTLRPASGTRWSAPRWSPRPTC